MARGRAGRVCVREPRRMRGRRAGPRTLGRAGRAIARPTCTAVNCAGLEPGAQSSAASQLPSERRPRALPPTGAESSLAV